MTPHHVFRQVAAFKEADFEGFGGLALQGSFEFVRIKYRCDAVKFVTVWGFGVKFLP